MGTLSPDTALQGGRPWPLGAHWDGHGVNFALFSAHAERVELCLFDDTGEHRLALPVRSDDVWHGYLPGAEPGLRYGFRVHGPAGPGHRFDPSRLLIDPYARELAGSFRYDADTSTPAPFTARVVHAPFDWGDDAPPATPLADSVLCELHVRGATRQHPDVPEALRGTYAGLASPAMLGHLKTLGVTAVKLLPVHAFLDEARLVAGGRTNYWGYNTLAFFAPEPRYAASVNDEPVIDEFRHMVRAFHAEGIEVILDVVFNHTAETDEFGPTVSFRGIDNASYYRLRSDDPTLYENYSGCGNTLKLAHPRVLQLVMDALRYWVAEMHVDGFRFDLAAALTRDSAFLAAVRQDPLLARVKLIAEPWDLGGDGYRLGRFPPGWSEWNDRFRDDVRAFWLTREVGVGALAQRLAGSSEIFRHDGRAPQAGINFITAHDGFTLRDLVSYQDKHNEQNGENNRDGHGHNLSWNCGCEGDSNDPHVLDTRRRLQRALLATVFVAQGVPMLQGGDEIGRTQRGNNNAYCQDNPLTWFDWQGADRDLCAFTAGLIALRRRLGPLCRRDWLTGDAGASGQRDIVWWHPDGREMGHADWEGTRQDALGFLLADAHIRLLVLINRDAATRNMHLPPGRWQRVCRSASHAPFSVEFVADRDPVDGRSVHLLLQE
ncbi:glycogen debranching protein GlgX [uncultured Propionivibrio sp.]|uniref:glycogen debranching protein GlgX n=1 Tax=uncultured Propionivibrio sp. TaxID=426737 RepID=UPI0029C0AEAB|nr:glycogen debranching protein GlgX [uncultured Propionivibrio sp.]